MDASPRRQQRLISARNRSPLRYDSDVTQTPPPTYKNGVRKATLDASIVSSGSRKSIKLDFISKRTSFAPWKNGSPKTPVGMAKTLNGTITLESSTDTDIIDASVEEIPLHLNWLRTPKSTTNKVVANVQQNCTAFPSERTPHQRQFIKEALAQKIVPRSQPNAVLNEPDPCYLAKSKQRNIEQWLAASAAVVEPAPALTPSPQLVADDDDSIDPAIKDVLVAVYGNNWKEHHLKKCQTDIKRKRQVAISASKTDVRSKQRKLEVAASNCKDPRSLFSEATPTAANVNSLVASKVASPSAKPGATRVRRKIFANIPTASSDLIKTPAAKRTNPHKIVTPSSPPLVSLPSTTKKKRARKVSVLSTESPIVIGGSTPTLVTDLSTPAPRSNLRGTPRRTFLASLSVSTPTSIVHPDAQFYKLNFAAKKDELAAKLFKLYNSKIFENKLAADMKITWNAKMRGTAGYCYNRRSTRGTVETRSARIELSTRVVDRADRLRDTLLHEMCHAAAWVIDGVANGHGAAWSSYASRARERFPEIPPISRRHNYEIAAKFTYRCTSCHYSINRQSRSIDLNRKRCGHCYGKFEILINKRKRGKTEVPEFDTTRTPRAPNGFALFVKDNYKKVKDAENGKAHGQIMKILGQQYAVYKTVITPGKK